MAVHRFSLAMGPDWIMEVGKDSAWDGQRHRSKEGKCCDYQPNDHDPYDNSGTVLSHGTILFPESMTLNPAPGPN